LNVSNCSFIRSQHFRDHSSNIFPVGKLALGTHIVIATSKATSKLANRPDLVVHVFIIFCSPASKSLSLKPMFLSILGSLRNIICPSLSPRSCFSTGGCRVET
jgi:hypothetical protein